NPYELMDYLYNVEGYVLLLRVCHRAQNYATQPREELSSTDFTPHTDRNHTDSKLKNYFLEMLRIEFRYGTGPLWQEKK
ncbi:hypothetical protein ACJX0J_011498, partial [Zea mays]